MPIYCLEMMIQRYRTIKHTKILFSYDDSNTLNDSISHLFCSANRINITIILARLHGGKSEAVSPVSCLRFESAKAAAPRVAPSSCTDTLPVALQWWEPRWHSTAHDTHIIKVTKILFRDDDSNILNYKRH
jgi:hypothetical protein